MACWWKDLVSKFWVCFCTSEFLSWSVKVGMLLLQWQKFGFHEDPIFVGIGGLKMFQFWWWWCCCHLDIVLGAVSVQQRFLVQVFQFYYFSRRDIPGISFQWKPLGPQMKFGWLATEGWCISTAAKRLQQGGMWWHYCRDKHFWPQ